MKNLYLTALILSTFYCAYAQTELTNLDLEQWTTSESGNYEEPIGSWKTANFGVDFDANVTTNPVEKVTDAYSGDYAAKMESISIIGTPTAGALWTGNFELNFLDPASSAKFGVPYEGKPEALQFYYKYFPVNGDSMGVYTILRKWNTDTHQQDTIAYAEVRQTETTSEYTLFDLQLDYFINDVQPDSIEIAFTSSAAGFEYMLQEGSALYIDEVKLINTVGIVDVLLPEVTVHTFPNPATDRLQFELGEAIPNAQLLIFDSMGRHITTLKPTTLKAELNVTDWNTGTYYFLLKNEKGQDLNSGNFNVL